MNRAAFIAILNDQHQVLLVRSLTSEQYNDHWSLPGGLVEPGENFIEGAIREAYEETSIICEPVSQISQAHTDEGLEVHVFQGSYVSGAIEIQAIEIADAQWFDLHEALDLPLAYNIKAELETLVS